MRSEGVTVKRELQNKLLCDDCEWFFTSLLTRCWGISGQQPPKKWRMMVLSEKR